MFICLLSKTWPVYALVCLQAAPSPYVIFFYWSLYLVLVFVSSHIYFSRFICLLKSLLLALFTKTNEPRCALFFFQSVLLKLISLYVGWVFVYLFIVSLKRVQIMLLFASCLHLSVVLFPLQDLESNKKCRYRWRTKTALQTLLVVIDCLTET